MDSIYIPNNPQYGVQFESTLNISSSITASSELNTLNGLLSPNGSQNNTTATYWNNSTDDMGSFSIPSLDFDPLPSLFSFSPNNLKSECNNYASVYNNILGTTPTSASNSMHPDKKQTPHDMADVLISLKHAVVNPTGQASTNLETAPLSPATFSTPAVFNPQQSQFNYTIHPPHQMLMSPQVPGAYSNGLCDQQSLFASSAPHYQSTAPPPTIFPSMSVNVSMNMTMHGYPANNFSENQYQVTCPQVQWNTSPPPNLFQTPSNNILSPNSYSTSAATSFQFAADFRSQIVGSQTVEVPLLTSNPTFKPTMLKQNHIGSPLSSFQKCGMRRSSFTSYPNSTSPILNEDEKYFSAFLSTDDESQRPNLCRICGKTYARPSTLKTHLRTHSGEKPYRCSDCSKSFSQAANLTAHVRTHSGEKPFRCPICDRRFSQSSSVTTHMRTHSGERPYRCRMCKKAFSDSSTLTKHLRIHSGEKPYQCKMCLLRFSQSGNLNRHMRVHGQTGLPNMSGFLG